MNPMKVIYLLVFTLFLITTSAFAPPGGCDPTHLLDRCMEKLGSFQYSGARVVITKQAADREVAISLLSGEDYRLIFYTKELPVGTEIKIFDKSRRESKRKLLADWVKTSKGWNYFLFDLQSKKSASVYFDYKIPKAERKSCLGFLLGYKLRLTPE